ncbi:MAG TPA: TatD family hydrolase [Vicinamibacterales bacterium]
MIDSHCHLADEAFVSDLDAVVSRAEDAGLDAVLCILDAAAPEELARARQLREAWPSMRFAVGVHPHRAAPFGGRLDEVRRLLDEARAAIGPVVAVGEMGLDYHYDFAPRDVQQEVFASQVAYAQERDLPIVVHTREADEDTLRILREAGRGRVRGVLHCFTGDQALADAAVGLGFYLSFSGIITFPRAGELREVASRVPEERLLIETDSPYLAPVPHRGKRNEPAFVAQVAGALASVRGLSRETVLERTDRNFTALFGPLDAPT